VKGLRLAGVGTLEAANAYLDRHFLPEWNVRWALAPANPTDAHRPVGEQHELAATLSHVETRRVGHDYTFHFRGRHYQIARQSAGVGMKAAPLRVEARLDGSIAARWEGKYLEISICDRTAKTLVVPRPGLPSRQDHNRGGRSAWMKNFSVSNRNKFGKTAS
jgi:hypothetical protein